MVTQLLSHLLVSQMHFPMTAPKTMIYAQDKRDFLFTFRDKSVCFLLERHWA